MVAIGTAHPGHRPAECPPVSGIVGPVVRGAVPIKVVAHRIQLRQVMNLNQPVVVAIVIPRRQRNGYGVTGGSAVLRPNGNGNRIAAGSQIHLMAVNRGLGIRRANGHIGHADAGRRGHGDIAHGHIGQRAGVGQRAGCKTGIEGQAGNSERRQLALRRKGQLMAELRRRIMPKSPQRRKLVRVAETPRVVAAGYPVNIHIPAGVDAGVGGSGRLLQSPPQLRRPAAPFAPVAVLHLAVIIRRRNRPPGARRPQQPAQARRRVPHFRNRAMGVGGRDGCRTYGVAHQPAHIGVPRHRG